MDLGTWAQDFPANRRNALESFVHAGGLASEESVFYMVRQLVEICNQQERIIVRLQRENDVVRQQLPEQEG